MKKLLKGKKGFTLVEMLIVLGIIAVLILLFIPNLAKQQAKIQDKGDQATIKVVETQAELFLLDVKKQPTLEELLKEEYLTNDQHKKAKEMQDKGKIINGIVK